MFEQQHTFLCLLYIVEENSHHQLQPLIHHLGTHTGTLGRTFKNHDINRIFNAGAQDIMENRIGHKNMIADVLLLSGPDVGVRHALDNDSIHSIYHFQDSSKNADNKNPSLSLQVSEFTFSFIDGNS